MLSLNISELKAHLSQTLDRVRHGESVLIRDRQRVIARIDPAGESSGAGDDEDWLADLELRGVLRRGTGGVSRAWLAQRPRVQADVVAALLDERGDGR